MKIGYGSCPGTCGELVQGYMGKKEYISSYCIDLYSKAVVSERKSISKNKRKGKSKSMLAVSFVFDHFGIDKSELDNVHIKIKSNISVGKGMASSTADVGASIIATLDYLNKELTPEEISKIVSRIEPTDSIFHKEICFFDPINGKKEESLGFLNLKKVLILEPCSRINTLKIRNEKEYYKILRENKSITEKSFELLKEGVISKDIKMVRKACENSALANERIKKTPYLRELIEISRECDYGFLNISHTGTVVGIALDERTDVDKLKYKIKNSEISKVYEKVYTRNIVKGGLRKGRI